MLDICVIEVSLLEDLSKLKINKRFEEIESLIIWQVSGYKESSFVYKFIQIMIKFKLSLSKCHAIIHWIWGQCFVFCPTQEPNALNS